MHLLNTLPQRLDPGATPTFAGLIAPSLTSPAATDLTLGTGTFGTALTVASATGLATFAGAVNVLNALTTANSLRVGNAGSNVFLAAENNTGGSFVLGSTAYAGLLVSQNPLQISVNNGGSVQATISSTGLALTGAATISSTTAGSSGAGALVVAGGGSFGGATYIGGTLATNTINGISGALTITSGSGSNFNLNAGTSGGAGFNFNSIGGSSYYTSNPGEALYFRSNTDASSGATTKNSPYFAFQSKYWDGAASQNTTALIELVASTTDASNYLSIGQWNFGGNAALQLYKTSLAAIFAGTVSPQQATTAAAPAYVKGAIYFDTTLNKLRVGGATAYETITSV